MSASNPLDVGVKWLRFFGGAIFTTYLASFVAGLLFLSADNFQRLGSLWIAILLVFAAGLRLVLDQISDAFRGRGANNTIFRKRLAPALFKEELGPGNYQDAEGRPLEHRRWTLEEATEFFEDFKSKAALYVFSNELVVAALATLQWGYGDLFHAWLMGGNDLA